jgi:hypothetical protein
LSIFVSDHDFVSGGPLFFRCDWPRSASKTARNLSTQADRHAWRGALIAGSIAVGVELFRLVHTPWLDAFRLTIPGALLLGRIFSASNMLAYGVGIVLGIWLDRFAIAAFTNTEHSSRMAISPRAETARTDATPPRCGV